MRQKKGRFELLKIVEEALEITGFSPERFFAAAVCYSRATRVNVREVATEYRAVKEVLGAGGSAATHHTTSRPVVAFAEWVCTTGYKKVLRWVDEHAKEIAKLIPK